MRNLLLYFLLCAMLPATAKTIYLHDHWQYKQVDSSIWRNTKVPGTIHTSLLHDKRIPDPFLMDYENSLQWIEKKDWEFRTTFSLDATWKKGDPLFLEFDGLDTYADVYLNEKKILHADNMFRTYRIDIRSWVLTKKNQLRIVFASAARITDSLAALSPFIRPCENNRHYARKAQYHFGWDWAPRYVTCGIWRPVKLIYGLPANAKAARYAPVHLIQENDSIGQSFYFTVNGKPTFMKGANWIPADMFLPRVSKAKYRSLLLAAKAANFNMLRVWGGGVYEDDYFYDLCDSLGIYVWQDFMFAGAMYPADSAALENIRHEAIDNILRLRRHPCIVLWCGNNEIDEAWHNWGWQQQFHLSSHDSTLLWQEYQKIFQELLPSLVHEYDSGRAYIASTPLYGWGRVQSMTHGDSHYWGMWWGMDSIQIMTKKIPRFMSEYGMQAMPSIQTVYAFAGTKNLDTASAIIRAHQKHPTGFQTLHSYLQMEKIPVTDFKSFILGTQELQRLALATTIQAQLHSKGRCMGSLLWQFNDCWPVCSWSIIDYYGRPKKAYNTVKKLYR